MAWRWRDAVEEQLSKDYKTESEKLLRRREVLFLSTGHRPEEDDSPEQAALRNAIIAARQRAPNDAALLPSGDLATSVPAGHLELGEIRKFCRTTANKQTCIDSCKQTQVPEEQQHFEIVYDCPRAFDALARTEQKGGEAEAAVLAQDSVRFSVDKLCTQGKAVGFPNLDATASYHRACTRLLIHLSTWTVLQHPEPRW